jgi:hypothetical protein
LRALPVFALQCCRLLLDHVLRVQAAFLSVPFGLIQIKKKFSLYHQQHGLGHLCECIGARACIGVHTHAFEALPVCTRQHIDLIQSQECRVPSLGTCVPVTCSSMSFDLSSAASKVSVLRSADSDDTFLDNFCS